MKLLLLTHAFNSLAQRLFVELTADGHEVSVELDIADAVTEEAVAAWNPDVVIAPFLKRRIPESVWSRRLCLVVHPGPPGDRGPSALDWAIHDGAAAWGVTVLQATGDYDAGPVWAARAFALRPDASKSSLYRHEVVEAALGALREALARWTPGAVGGGTAPPDGRWRPMMTQAERAIDWSRDATADALRRLRAADGTPGVADALFGAPAQLFDAHPASAADLARAPAGAPGAVVARRGPALLRRTVDGALWIGHVRRRRGEGEPTLKLAATRAFAAEAAALPELAVPLERDEATWDELRYREVGPPGARAGLLSFDFHNGAMSLRQCRRLEAALHEVAQRSVRVLVLDGGADFFSNGIHLHEIEAAQLEGGSAADASMAHIEAIDDVVLAILSRTDRWVVAALRGNAGAGGCFLALAADTVWAHGGVVQNPHYRNMGNLHGSEYWTYLLPRRVGEAAARELMRARLPMGAPEAHARGLVDAVLTPSREGFEAAVQARALALADSSELAARIADKAARRAADEAARPLAAYRAEELALMHRNFYGFDASYHVARHHFVHRKPHAWTPRHLARHR
ncbi:MAG TPA: enoyl-CoA hydratase-related protein [Burkholderiaceae bacterium]|nr:enoyl-CoA hydratase-related protein [Burkholderiaceae bacterium]